MLKAKRNHLAAKPCRIDVVTARLIAHSDVDDFCVIRVPKGWRIGHDFKPRLDGILLPNSSGIAIRVDLKSISKLSWAALVLNLDGADGYSLGCWCEFSVRCKKVELAALLDQDVAKTFAISLADPSDSSVSITRDFYIVLVQPEIAVMENPRA
ncbi:MAG: hypothetical protein ACRESS_09825 [Stenotrophobium sp.]